MSKTKTVDRGRFKENPFNGERVRWEEFHRFIRIAIQEHEHLPEHWLNYLFEDFPLDDTVPGGIVYPEEYVNRVIPPPVALTASAEAQRNRESAISRGEKHNERVRKCRAIFVTILNAGISQNLKNIFHDTYNVNAYTFYGYLKNTFGPASNQNEDKSVAMHRMMTMTMGHSETFTSFMTKFEHKAKYLKLKKDAKRGLLTSTLINTEGKFQMLPERLIPELKKVRETDMSYAEMITWITQADVNQHNDGLKVIKIKKIKTENEQPDRTKIADREKDKPNLMDPNGMILNPRYLCYQCSNYGHSSRDCLAPYCNQCETVRPEHRSNACPNPKDNKRSRRGKRAVPEAKKSKGNAKTPIKHQPKRAVKSVSSTSYLTDEDADDESLRMNAEFDREEDSPAESDDYADNKSIRKSRRLRTIKLGNDERTFIRQTSKRSNINTLVLHDSGAQAHAARSERLLTKTVQVYDKNSRDYTQLKGASGEDLKASAVGTIHGLDAPVIVANIEDDVIVSTTQMSASNYWTIHPPIGLFPGVGVIIFKHNEIGKCGKLMTIGNEDMYSDPTTWNRFDIDIKIPDMSPIQQLLDDVPTDAKRSPRWMTISRVQGMERLTSKEQVLFQQRIWFATKKRMLWYIDHIPSFPLKKSQLELYFNHDEVGKIRGHFMKRSHHSANVYDQSEDEEMKVYEKMSMKEVIQDNSKKSHHREELRNMVIGYETGSDIVPGPNNKSYRAVFVDKASGFKWSASLPKKSHLPEAFTQYCEFM